MVLDDIIDAIKTFPGITRKNAIHEIVNHLPIDNFKNILISKGEDAAAIEYGDDYILFATDGIMESLTNSDPFYAGYFAVLVNINDIAAMGGKPLAMVDVLSFSKGQVCLQVLDGMKKAINKFNVPIVGGHTHPDCNYNAIDISIIGTVPKANIIKSCSANNGDDVVFVFDMDGFYPQGLKYAWDTTSNKDDDLVRAQINIMTKVASEHLVNAGKDMSNPGSIGTLGMMLESSQKGATIDISKIPVPEGIDLTRWILSYQGFGFTFSCPPENSEKLIKMFESVGCVGVVVGSVNNSKKLILEMDGKSKILFDFDFDIITGCSPKK